MKRVVTSANDKADLANANRRNFLRQVGTGAGMLAAGIVLNATTSATTLPAIRGSPMAIGKAFRACSICGAAMGSRSPPT